MNSSDTFYCKKVKKIKICSVMSVKTTGRRGDGRFICSNGNMRQFRTNRNY